MVNRKIFVKKQFFFHLETYFVSIIFSVKQAQTKFVTSCVVLTKLFRALKGKENKNGKLMREVKVMFNIIKGTILLLTDIKKLKNDTKTEHEP